MIRSALAAILLAVPAAALAQTAALAPAKPAATSRTTSAGKAAPGKASGSIHKASVPPAPAPVPAAAPPPPPPPPPPEPAKGSATGLPLPRFAALKSDEVNLRSGPGERYPIEWVYKRRDLPVEIEREFEVWRLVADPDGIKGWVHQATLTGRRTFIVTGSEQVVRADPRDTASPVARLKPGVIGRIRSCEATALWCQVQIADYHGWLKRTALWGLYPGEAVQ
jgi:SH3-like domain-containing protein